MLQNPVNYCGTPCQCQPSYNAVKIDIHNPKVMDGQPPMSNPMYPSAYAMPINSCYAPQTNGIPYYPQMPQANPNVGYVQQPVYYPQQSVYPMPQPVPVAPQPQPVPAVPQPVPVVPTPIQQVINNGVPQTQNIVQNPPQEVKTNATAVDNRYDKANIGNPAEVKTPKAAMNPVDISTVLKGLQSNNLAEQSEALNKIGEAGNNPEEIKKYLETSVLDSLLGILNADTKNLPAATPEQIDARTKWMNEMELPDNEKTMTEKEKELAMTLAPQEVADKNKQHAMYSIAILQRALADAIEAKTGEKISIEKLPAIDQIVNVVKSNPSPLLRASAIVALAHLNKPEYKPVLSDIFTIAQNDQDPNVKQVAAEALNKINGVEQTK